MAEDCPVERAEIPPLKEPKSAARIQYEMVIDKPYVYTSDDVLYASNGKRKGMSREQFFSTGQPCFRASPLPKRYGWGVHCNHEGRIALYAVQSDEYKRFAEDAGLVQRKAMRSKR